MVESHIDRDTKSAIALSDNKGDRTLKKQQLRYTQNIRKLL
ncbi:hypothetical protein [Microcoleus sp. B9-D4]